MGALGLMKDRKTAPSKDDMSELPGGVPFGELWETYKRAYDPSKEHATPEEARKVCRYAGLLTNPVLMADYGEEKLARMLTTMNNANGCHMKKCDNEFCLDSRWNEMELPPRQPPYDAKSCSLCKGRGRISDAQHWMRVAIFAKILAIYQPTDRKDVPGRMRSSDHVMKKL